MRKSGLLAFSITTLVLVPAAVHRLSAGKEAREKLSTPDNQVISLGKARIAVSLDKYMLDPDEGVRIHLAATEVTTKHLELGVLVLGSNGSEGSRVPSPPNGVAFQTVKLDVKDGAAEKEITVKLRGAQQNQYEPFGHYTVLVGPPKAIAKLESLRGRSHYIGDEDEGIPSLNKSGEKFMSFYYRIEQDPIDENEDGKIDDSPYQRGKIARLEAHTRPKSDAISITVPDSAKVGQEFSVTVSVTNPSKHAMKDLKVDLSEHLGFNLDYDENRKGKLSISPASRLITLDAKETQQLTFLVKATEPGVVAMYSQATCTIDYTDESKCRDVQALQLGAFDATEVGEIFETKTHTVVTR